MSAPVFLFGTARSGTTWLQNMLGAHPSIATPQELDLFSDYIAAFDVAWRNQLPESDDVWSQRRHKGLPSLLSESEMTDVLRGLVQELHDRVLSLKPGAAIVLEKTPGYSYNTPLIVRLFPEARLIHMVRDGRDVAASLMRASRGWGRSWAFNDAERCAEAWRINIECGRLAKNITDRYLEVRFEQLRSDAGPEVLQHVFEFVGTPVSTDEAKEIYRRYDLEAARAEGRTPASSILFAGEVARAHQGAPPEPEGFYGEGRAGVWRDELTTADRIVFDRVAGDVLVELEYEPDRSWARKRGPGRPVALGKLQVARAAQRARFALGAARRELTRPLVVGPSREDWSIPIERSPGDIA